MNRTLRIATCQFQVGMIASWDAFEKKLDLMLGEAKRGGADLALLPEYFSMELATMFGTAVRESLPKQLEALQPWIRKFRLYVTDRVRSRSATTTAAIAIAASSRRPMAANSSRTSIA